MSAALKYSGNLGARPIYDLPVSLYSGAFAISMSGGGLGGYARGHFPRLPLSRGKVQLMHITDWEFVALAFNSIIFGPRVVSHAVSLFADALSAI